MIPIQNKAGKPLSRDTIGSLNQKTTGALTKDTVKNLNLPKMGNPQGSTAPPSPRPSRQPAPNPRPVNPSPAPVQRLPDMTIPTLQHPLQKGQKTSLTQGQPLTKLQVCFGWNILDGRCDMDASAFLVTQTGKVPGDDWFVFYSQTVSPDGSVRFTNDASRRDREIIHVDFGRLDPAIQKIVFVLTINEAFQKNLNFSMIKDAYIRLLDGASGRELVSYKLEEYYPNVTSMTIGELYLHGGQWKFNPVGNGVHQDLAGQCAIYGVAISE